MAVIAIHPGEHLAEELKTLGMSAAELARNLGVPTNRITQILNAQRAVTGDTALRLAHFFGTTPEFWLNLQNLYELRLAQRRAGSVIQSLPSLKSVNNTIRLKHRRAAAEFEEDQGKVVSRAARRTR
jgi:addiction module HigA family antidote